MTNYKPLLDNLKAVAAESDGNVRVSELNAALSTIRRLSSAASWTM